MTKLSRRDWLTVLVCIGLTAVFLAIGIRYFDRAFPEASITFDVDRTESEQIARAFLQQQKVDVSSYRHSAAFTHDDEAKIFLERKLGLERATALMRNDVEVWQWRHRWFKPLQKEQVFVEISPRGELVQFAHLVPDEAAAPNTTSDSARAIAERFLLEQKLVPAIDALNFLGISEKALPHRRDFVVTFESKSVRPAGAPYRYELTVRGSAVSEFRQTLRVPEQWTREYSALRSKNEAAGAVDSILFVLTGIAALVFFIIRLRRHQIDIRFAVTFGLIGFALTVLTSLNSYPLALAGFDTNESFQNFVGREALQAILGGFVSGVFVMIIAGVGESFYRQRYPQHLAIPRLFQRKALRSRRVFLGFILGFTLFAGFLAYQVVFYLVAAHYGAWSPAEVPYDDMVSTLFPWAAVLFMGFFPAVTEEFMSRAFSIPWFEKLFRSRVAAIVLAGFIWGFGHAAYPNQPFFIRGVEVGIAGVIIGVLMIRFGLLPLLVWHYTVDALYTSFLLVRSGDAYLTTTAIASSLIFAVPLLISIVLYLKNGGFEEDEELLNAAAGFRELPSVDETPAQPEAAAPQVIIEPPAERKPLAWIVTAALIVIAVFLVALRRETASDIDRYPTTKAQAISIAKRKLYARGFYSTPSRVAVAPAGGFRYWQDDSGGEDGGQPAGYDSVSAEYVLEHAPVSRLLQIETAYVPAATWAVRFFEAEQRHEIRVEVDPRTRALLGLHEILEENARGARLERDAAEKIARADFARFGLAVQYFDTKEALRFEQPARRDWLFHFEERSPLVAEAHRRISVRVAGDRVTQFTRTIHIPESARREATQQTALNTILIAAKIAGSVLALYLIVGGIIASTQKAHFAWRGAIRIALWCSPLLLAATAVRFPTLLYDYDTAVAWGTFLTTAGVQATVMFVAMLIAVWLTAAVALTCTRALRVQLVSESTPDAATRVVAAIAVTVATAALTTIIAAAMHDRISVRALSPSDLVMIPLPIFDSLATVLLQALALVAVVSSVAASPLTPRRRFAVAAVALFLFLLNSSVTPHELPVALLLAGITTASLLIVWFKLLGPNPKAVLYGAVAIALLSQLRELLAHGRTDLMVQAAVLVVIVILVPKGGRTYSPPLGGLSS